MDSNVPKAKTASSASFFQGQLKLSEKFLNKQTFSLTPSMQQNLFRNPLRLKKNIFQTEIFPIFPSFEKIYFWHLSASQNSLNNKFDSEKIFSAPFRSVTNSAKIIQNRFFSSGKMFLQLVRSANILLRLSRFS